MKLNPVDVLASTHPLRDACARQFRSACCEGMLNRRESVGRAALAARRSLAKERPGAFSCGQWPHQGRIHSSPCRARNRMMMVNKSL
jgi:hypothetical protein